MLFNLIFTASYQDSLIHPFPEALAPSSMLAECLAASHGECGKSLQETYPHLHNHQLWDAVMDLHDNLSLTPLGYHWTDTCLSP